MSDNILEYIENKKVLENLCSTSHDFNAIFPKEKFDFSSTDFEYYLYLDTEESKAYLLDFLLFIANNYSKPVFSIENFKLIMTEFEKYLLRHKVFFYNKTMMGVHLSGDNPELLLKSLERFFGKHFKINDKEPYQIAFSKKITATHKKYTFSFFYYLSKKLDGYNIDKFVVEPLLNNTVTDISNFFKGIKYPYLAPFFLDSKHEFFQETKPRILANIVDGNFDKLYSINTSKCVALVTIKKEKHVATMDIIVDYSYYDTEIFKALLFICYDVFNNFDVEKIKTTNQNKHLGYSAINNALTIAGFKPEYSLDTNLDGYSIINYELNKDDLNITDINISKSLIKFLF